VDLHDAVVARRMVRSFATDPVSPETVRQLCDDALRAPSAGHTRGTDLIVLTGPAETGRYWDHATTPDWREREPRWPGLSRAPVIVLVVTSPERYRARYDQPDKRRTGTGVDSWPIPYWYADAGMVVLLLLLGATDRRLASCFLGTFLGEEEVLAELAVPEGRHLVGAVLVGHPDGADRRSASLDRSGPSRTERVHVGGWGRTAS
jgi:nitroreductase